MTHTPPETTTTDWSQTHRTSAPDSGRRTSSRSDWVASGTLFAGVMMLVSGCLGVLNGIAAIAKDDVYSNIGQYVYAFDLTTWGWIHLVIGALVALTGWGVLKDKDWARGAGIGFGALYVVEYFLFLPYAPVWSVICIGVGVFVIWSLAAGPGRTADTRTADPA